MESKTKNTQEENKLIGEVSQEQIEKWKADPRIKKVHGIITEGHICYVKHPDRNVISYALRHATFKMSMEQNYGKEMEMNMGDLYKKGEAVLNNCWIGGSEEIRNDSDLWVGACISAGELVQYKNAELKNF